MKKLISAMNRGMRDIRHSNQNEKSRSDAIQNLNCLPEKLGKWKRIRSGINDREKQFSVECVAIKVKQYNQSGTRQKHPNVLQRRTGIDEMPLVAGQTPYYSLLKA